MSKSQKFRLNVAGILRDSQGRILVCERLGHTGAWQFPQGGVDDGESLEQALFRELREEIGVDSDSYAIVAQKGPYRYAYDGGPIRGVDGKDQHFFLAHYSGPQDAIQLDLPHPEFQAYQWIAPSAFQIDWLPNMKKVMYQHVFADLLDTKLS